MERFEIGEVAIGQNHVLDIELNGMECVIIEPLRFVRARKSDGQMMLADAYLVQWADGRQLYAEPCHLRKRRPPTTDESEYRQAMLDCIERAKRGQEIPA